MHGFGTQIFLGGPLVWLAILLGGFILLRKVLLPHTPTRGDKHDQYDANAAGDVYAEADIYRLAAGFEGKITVSDLVTELGIEPQKAEETLEAMTDGVRVRMEVDEDGMIFYTFPELQR